MISKEEEEERDGEEEESETGFEPSEINIRAQAEHTQADDFQLPHEKKKSSQRVKLNQSRGLILKPNNLSNYLLSFSL